MWYSPVLEARQRRLLLQLKAAVNVADVLRWAPIVWLTLILLTVVIIHSIFYCQKQKKKRKLDMLLVAPLPCIFPRLTPSKHCQSVKSHSVMVLPKYDVELISSAEDKTSPSYFGVDDQFSTSTASRSAGPTQV